MDEGRLKVIISAGPAEDPLFGYAKDDFVTPEDGEEPAQFLMRLSAVTIDVLDEAKESIERQAGYFAQQVGDGPQEGS